jgi:hypothetical protein
VCQKLWQAVDKLKAKCAEEMKKNMEIEERVRNEVCTTMQKQIIELENTYKYVVDCGFYFFVNCFITMT